MNTVAAFAPSVKSPVAARKPGRPKLYSEPRRQRSFTLPADLDHWVCQQARRQGCSIGQVIEGLLARGQAEAETQQLPPASLPGDLREPPALPLAPVEEPEPIPQVAPEPEEFLSQLRGVVGERWYGQDLAAVSGGQVEGDTLTLYVPDLPLRDHNRECYTEIGNELLAPHGLRVSWELDPARVALNELREASWELQKALKPRLRPQEAQSAQEAHPHGRSPKAPSPWDLGQLGRLAQKRRTYTHHEQARARQRVEHYRMREATKSATIASEPIPSDSRAKNSQRERPERFPP